jgi:predicted DCC family thiol-disulfide oxidoreductase YuxK
MRLRLQETLDAFASIALIVASAFVVMALLGFVGGDRAATPPGREVYARGEMFPDVLNTEPGRPIAVLWLNTRCRYCEESMAFYRRAVESQGAETVVVVGTESETHLRDYLSKHGLGSVTVKSVPAGSVKFAATPALAILDSNRRVANVWVGKLPPRVEDEALSTLARLRKVAGGAM